MSIQKFNLPDPGEGLPDAEVASWKVKPGDTVKVNDVVVEVETAKSLVELPIPWAGVVRELLVAEGDTVDVGTPIIAVEVNDGVPAQPEPPSARPAQPQASANQSPAPADQSVPAEPSVPEERSAPEDQPAPAPAGQPDAARSAAAQFADAFQPDPGRAVEEGSGPNLVGYGASAAATKRRARAGASSQAAAAAAASGSTVLAKPATRGLAKEHGIDLHDVPASGAGGIVTDEDVLALLTEAGGVNGTGSGSESTGRGTASGGDADRRETRTPVKGVRKVTAEAMINSAFTAPHVTEFVTVDATATMELVDRLAGDREFKDVRVTPLLVIARALCIAVRRNPGMNAFWDEAAGEIVTKHYVNLGIAAATPRGLIVPNIKDADRLSMRELGSALGDLVDTARAGKTQPRDQAGGTITITNVGVFGIDTGTPIINPGESAIVCLGAVRRMPWVVTGADGAERIEPRWVTQLGCSFDHRLIDGELGSRFLADLAALVTDPALALVWA